MMTRTILVLLTILLLSGCGGTRNWKEEVQLADNRIVVIDRYDKLGNPLDQEPGNRVFGSPVVGFVLRIPVEGSSFPVTWESGPHLIPLALGIKEGRPYIAASPNTCAAYDMLGRPVPPYVFFRYDGKEWRRISVDAFPEEIKTANLLLGTRNYDARQEIDTGLVKADAVKRINLNTSPDLRTIYRSGVRGKEGCIWELEQLDKNRRK